MSRRSDDDQAAYAWRERRTIVTFDFDFFDPTKLPQTRNPGVIVVDCDRQKRLEVERAVDAFAAFERLVGPVRRKMRIVVGGDGHVSVWDSNDPRSAPNARYRFLAGRRPEEWVRE